MVKGLRSVVLAAAVASVVVIPEPANAAAVLPVDLGSFGEPNSLAAGINEGGWVAGWSYGGGASRAVVWSPEGSITDLGNLGGDSAAASAINESGQVAGWYQGSESNEDRAFVWDSAEGMADLGTLGGPSARAEGLNDVGQVVGASSFPGPYNVHAFVWDRINGMAELPTLGGVAAFAADISNSGQAVGASYLPGTRTLHAVLWDPVEGAIDLGGFGGTYAVATDINDAGQVAGYARVDDPSTPYRAQGFLWDPEEGVTFLGLPAATSSNAFRTNELGQIVGASTVDGRSQRWLWDAESGYTTLGSLGGRYSDAIDVNDAGVVVGGSGLADAAHVHAAKWNVPPPTRPMISVGDATIDEGHLGDADRLSFTVRLSEPTSELVTVRYRLVSNTASPPTDYDDRGNVWRTLRFKPSTATGLTQTLKTINVRIPRDEMPEMTENFRVALADPSPGWTIGRGLGLGTIRDDPLDDDPFPGAIRPHISDAVVVEGDGGGPVFVKVWVTLSYPAEWPSYRQRLDVTSAEATDGVDFVSATRTVHFNPGESRRLATVAIVPDSDAESPETILIGEGSLVGRVTILDDD